MVLYNPVSNFFHEILNVFFHGISGLIGFSLFNCIKYFFKIDELIEQFLPSKNQIMPEAGGYAVQFMQDLDEFLLKYATGKETGK